MAIADESAVREELNSSFITGPTGGFHSGVRSTPPRCTAKVGRGNNAGRQCVRPSSDGRGKCGLYRRKNSGREQVKTEREGGQEQTGKEAGEEEGKRIAAEHREGHFCQKAALEQAHDDGRGLGL